MDSRQIHIIKTMVEPKVGIGVVSAEKSLFSVMWIAVVQCTVTFDSHGNPNKYYCVHCVHGSSETHFGYRQI